MRVYNGRKIKDILGKFIECCIGANIGVECAKKFSEALMVNTVLTKLNIDCDERPIINVVLQLSTIDCS